MDAAVTPSRHLFVVRIWAETPAAYPAVWRGCVEHVSTGARFYFSSLADLTDFIALVLDNHVPLPADGAAASPTNLIDRKDEAS